MVTGNPKNNKTIRKTTSRGAKSASRISVLSSMPFGQRGLLIAFVIVLATFGLRVIFRSKAAVSSYQTIAPTAFCPDSADYTRVKQLWPALKDQYKAWAPSMPSPSWGSSAAYVLPDYLLSPLEMAVGCSDTAMISDIAEIYLAGSQSSDYQPLTDTDGVTRRYWKSAEGEPDTSAAQWYGALSRTLAVIAATPASQRTSVMNQYVTTYKSTIAGFYKNRLYTATNWQGGGAAAFINTMIARDYLKEDTYSPPAISKYLYGLSQVYLAYKADPSTIDLAGNGYPLSEATIVQTLKDGSRLLKQRSTATNLTNLQGRPVTGYNYEVGYWQNLADNQYSEYDGPCYPILDGPTQMSLASNLASYLSNGQVTSCTTPGYRVPIVRNYETSWDTSHMYIPIMFWRAMYTIQPLIGSDFPMYSDMQKYANQLAYGVSNKDMNLPRFKNYWSGSNGWVRLNYSAPNAPWQTSAAFMDNGLGGMLGGFNPDLVTMTRRTRDIMNSPTAADQAATKFNYSVKATDKGTAAEGTFNILEPYYRNYETPSSYYWFLFLSSIPPANFVAPNGSGATPVPTPVLTPVPTATPAPSAQIVPTLAVGCRRIEAEGMVRGAGPTLTTQNPYYSSTGYVENYGPAGAYVETTYLAANGGTYNFTLRYGAGYGDTSRDVYLDGTKLTSLLLTDSGSFAIWTTATTSPLQLSASTHTIRFQVPGGTYANLDYVDVCPVSVATPTPPPTAAPTPTATPALTPSPTPTSTPLPVCTKSGDANCDGRVNTLDLQAVLSSYGKRTTLRSQGDLTGDGVVNVFDLSQVLQNWGK